MQKSMINANTGAEKEELSRQMSSFTKNLMVNHDEFSKAIDRRVQALSLQNAAIMRFLLEQYQDRGEIFPFEWLIPNETVEMYKSNDPQIHRVATEISFLQNELTVTNKKILEIKFR